MSPLSAATADAIYVLVADSNRMQAQLLTNALRRSQEFRLIICAMDSASIQDTLATAPVRVALLSPSSGSYTESMATVRRLHLTHPEIVQVLLLASSNREQVVSAFRAGVRGIFCISEANLRLLRRCIHCVARGQIWVNTEQMNYFFDMITEAPSLTVLNSRGEKLLTPREEQVVALVAEGLGNRGIAAKLNLSEHTVKKYLFRIFDKLGISTRVELVLYAVSQGSSEHTAWLSRETVRRAAVS